MQNSDSADSSLQAILYIDAPGGRTQKQRRPSRIPGAVAVGACALAALCAVGAITYSVKQAPVIAVSHDLPLHVTHPAAAQREMKREVKTEASAKAIHPLQRAVAAVPLVAVVAPQPAQVAQPIIKQPLQIKKAPAPVVAAATASPTVINVVAKPVAVKPAVKTVVAATPQPKSQSRVAVTPHHVYHHHLHRRLAAYMPGTAAAATTVAVNTKSTVADPMIITLHATPTTIPEGSGATLCVAARNATQLSLSGLGEVNPGLLDCRHVSPNVTTTFTAWAVNKIGVTVSQSVTLTVTH